MEIIKNAEPDLHRGTESLRLSVILSAVEAD